MFTCPRCLRFSRHSSASPSLATRQLLARRAARRCWGAAAALAGFAAMLALSAPVCLAGVVNAATTTTISSSVNPSYASGANDSTNFTATVTSTGGTVNAGAVEFYENGSAISLCAAVTVSNGSAQCPSVVVATQGISVISATYSGAIGFAASSSANLNQLVEEHPTKTSNTWCNNNGFAVPASGVAGAVYPSVIQVSGYPAGSTVSNVTVTLNGLYGTVDAQHLLVAPSNSYNLDFFDGSWYNNVLTSEEAVSPSFSDSATSYPAWGGTPASDSYLASDQLTPPQADTFASAVAPSIDTSIPQVPAANGNPATNTPGAIEYGYDSEDASGRGPVTNTFSQAFNGAPANGDWALYGFNNLATTENIGGWCIDLTVNIAKTTPTITWPTPAAISYGTRLSATQLNATANVAGTFVYSPSPGTQLGTGSQTLKVTFTPSDTTDYTTATASVQLTVNPVSYTAPALLNPGATLAGGSTTFSWTQGSGITYYELKVGIIEASASYLYNGGAIAPKNATYCNDTTCSVTVGGIPAHGADVFIRLWYETSGVWKYIDYIDTEAGTLVTPSMDTPTPGSTPAASQSFTWFTGVGPTAYSLQVGTWVAGAHNIYNSGTIAAPSVETATTTMSSPAASIPATYGPIYVTLGYYLNGSWKYLSFTYSEPLAPPALQNPGATLTGSSNTFTWSAGSGSRYFELKVGSYGGASDLYNGAAFAYTGSTYCNVSTCSVTVNNLPTSGANLYIRLWYQQTGTWKYIDYTDTEAGAAILPRLKSPLAGPGLVLAANQVFTWYTGVGPARYSLQIGTNTAGAHNLYNSGTLAAPATETSTTTMSSPSISIPFNRGLIYLTLGYYMNGSWNYIHAVYSERFSPPSLLNPGITLSGGSNTFTWNQGDGSTYFEFKVGETGYGTSDVYNTGILAPTNAACNATTCSVTVNNIPQNGARLYLRLFYQQLGKWKYIDYTDTAAATTE